MHIMRGLEFEHSKCLFGEDITVLKVPIIQIRISANIRIILIVAAVTTKKANIWTRARTHKTDHRDSNVDKRNPEEC